MNPIFKRSFFYLFGLLYAVRLTGGYCAEPQLLYDEVRFGRASIVLRAQLISRGEGSLFCSETVKILEIYKAPSQLKIYKTFTLNYLHTYRGNVVFGKPPPDFYQGVPKEVCTIYLEPSRNPGQWQLLGATEDQGVSNVENRIGSK